MRIWSIVAEMLVAHERCALVTVAAVRGSAPREPGARMVIAPDGGFRGTIGGGELEWRAIGAARDALLRDVPCATLDRLALGPELGQCCGGSVQLVTEVFDRERLDEVRALAAREAAGPFATRGRIGPAMVERVVIGGAARNSLDPTGTNPPNPPNPPSPPSPPNPPSPPSPPNPPTGSASSSILPTPASSARVYRSTSGPTARSSSGSTIAAVHCGCSARDTWVAR